MLSMERPLMDRTAPECPWSILPGVTVANFHQSPFPQESHHRTAQTTMCSCSRFSALLLRMMLMQTPTHDAHADTHAEHPFDHALPALQPYQCHVDVVSALVYSVEFERGLVHLHHTVGKVISVA